MDSIRFIAPKTPLMRRLYLWAFLGAFLFLALSVTCAMLYIAPIGGWQQADAVLHVDEKGKLSVDYQTATGEAITGAPLNDYVSGAKEGMSVRIRYEVANPSHVEPYQMALLLVVVFGLSCVLMCVFAVHSLQEERKQQRAYARLAKDGVAIDAHIVTIYPDFALSRRGRRERCRMDCVYYPSADDVQVECLPIEHKPLPEGQQMWLFSSQPFANPHAQIEGTVRVFVLPDDPSCYYVDTGAMQVISVQKEEENNI